MVKIPGVVRIAAVGDIMMPASIQRAVARNGHNYDILFEKISRDLHADLTFANLRGASLLNADLTDAHLEAPT